MGSEDGDQLGRLTIAVPLIYARNKILANHFQKLW